MLILLVFYLSFFHIFNWIVLLTMFMMSMYMMDTGVDSGTM